LENDKGDGKEQQDDKIDQGENFSSNEGLAVVGFPYKATWA